jgi:hypothetical protein
VDVQGVLEILAGAGVEHRPLGRDVSAIDQKGNDDGISYESGSVTGNPGDEDDLVPAQYSV